MAVPKRKTSKARRDKRRASSYRLNKTTVVECPQCHEPKQPHRVCRSCGYYKSREVIVVE
ncbi:MAG: 50S ribosomal protein L32 [Gudongella sp.]|jgi:large subunit ribosomal protein L32|uniref:50S ribosomal protein L32 n=1 Tax=Gudongella sp. SC589 TaxID=3385990 RepID=UPI002D2E2185|nr:50S ribosomal protein L32 [Gudongella sp.]HZH93251.1 50S ribosomal protein L32 [Tissierellaceae bacterium]